MNGCHKKIIYFGLGIPPAHEGVEWLLCPLIQIAPVDLGTEELRRSRDVILQTSSIVVTSKVAAGMLQALLSYHHIPLTTLQEKIFFSVGRATTQALLASGWDRVITSPDETQEGLATTIAAHVTSQDLLFWGHSGRARSYLGDFLRNLPCRTHTCMLYDTLLIPPDRPIDLSAYDALFFTSPSSVHSFLQHLALPPCHLVCISQGPITKGALDAALPTSKKLLYSDMLPLFAHSLDNAL